MSKLIAMIVAPLALAGIARAQPQPEIPPPSEQHPAEQPSRDVGPACDALGMRTRARETEHRNVTERYERQDRNLNPSPSSQGMENATPEAGIEGTQGFGEQGDGELSPGFFEGQQSVRGESPAEYPTSRGDIHAGFGGGAPY